ncbi:carbonic anhydrase [Streptomyces sp. NPDC050743]|uniref:carbonic anhydrase n=1 Tax=Streptomyces sp. NPDC050743 TaxID=3365634 RepID=UPI0037B2E518
MINTEDLVTRNAAFAARGAHEGLHILGSGQLMVIGCVDSRVDPSHVLGLDLGEVTAIRNVGGRVTPAVLRTLAMLTKVSAAHRGDRPAGTHIVVMHHTECGIKDIAAFPEMLASDFDIPVEALDGKAVMDPFASVRVDVGVLKTRMPAGLVTGLVYDVETGLVEVVAPTMRVGEE